MSEVFKAKGLQVSVAVVCTRIGSCAAKGREGTRWQGGTWARGKDLAQRETGDRMTGRYIFRSRVPAVGYQVQVFGFGCRCGNYPEPGPDAEHLNLAPGGRDLRPETPLHATIPSARRPHLTYCRNQDDTGHDLPSSAPPVRRCRLRRSASPSSGLRRRGRPIHFRFGFR